VLIEPATWGRAALPVFLLAAALLSRNNFPGVFLGLERGRIEHGSAFCLPSFFVVGPPRTGTSWLHEVLQPHAVLPTLAIETRFFDTHFHRGFDWYSLHFRRRQEGQPVGEIAPTYFVSAKARDRISHLPSRAKVLCIFRNPVERIVSLYRLKSAYGLIRWTFEEALVRDPELLESSKYSAHFKAWQEVLGRENVMPALFDDLQQRPQWFVDEVADFIGIPRFRLSPSQVARVHASDSMTRPRSYLRTHSAMLFADWLKARRLNALVTAFKRSPFIKLVLGGGCSFDRPSRDVWLRLQEYCRPETEALEILLGRDLSSWKELSANQLVVATSPSVKENSPRVVVKTQGASRAW